MGLLTPFLSFPRGPCAGTGGSTGLLGRQAGRSRRACWFPGLPPVCYVADLNPHKYCRPNVENECPHSPSFDGHCSARCLCSLSTWTARGHYPFPSWVTSHRACFPGVPRGTQSPCGRWRPWWGQQSVRVPEPLPEGCGELTGKSQWLIFAADKAVPSGFQGHS